MPSIQLQIQDGPAVNRRQIFEGDALRYGRDADNDIVLTLATASREHGEVLFKDGHWMLNNLSANGTEVNGKLVKKPRLLSDGDTVSIGGHAIFRVHSIDATAADAQALAAQAGDAGEDDDSITSSGKTTGMDRNTKLLPAIFIASALLTVVVIIIGSVFSDAPTVEQDQPVVLTGAAFAEDVRRPIAVDYPDPREANRYLERAQQFQNQLEVRPENVYYAWEAYHLSLAHAGKSRFESGLDQRQFFNVQDRLARDIEREYIAATDKIQRGEYAEASRQLGALLTRIYPRRDGPVVQNISDQRAYATSRVSR